MVGTILVLVGASIYLLTSRHLLAGVDRDLAARSVQLAMAVRGLDMGDPRFDREGYSGGGFALLVDASGRVLSNPQRVDLNATLPLLPGPAPRYQTVTIVGEPVRLYVPPVGGEPGPGRRNPPGRAGLTPDVVLVVGRSLVSEETALRRVLAGLLVAGGGGTLLSLAGAWFLAGRALVPIEAAFRRQREFVADASHELRTPLTALRAAADLLDRHRDEPLAANGKLFDDLRNELSRLERLAGELLTLARAGLGEFSLAVAPLDLAVLAGEVVRRTVPLAG